MEKISVVVPVYNGEKYLEQCVQSIMNQTYENLEILLINDGSSDRSGQIIEDLRTRDQRIRVLHKPKNEGSGAARNSSISMATGNYLLFVDSDDWLDANHVEDLYDLLRRTNSDIAVTNFTQYYESGGGGRYNIHIRPEDYYEKVYSPQEWFEMQYGQPSHLSTCFTVPWCKLYKRSLFENIIYYTGDFGDDDWTTWKLYLLSDRIAYMHRASLVYRINEKSQTQTANMATIFSHKPVADRLALLSLLDFDVSREVAAYKWRAHLNRDHALATGDMDAYKELKFQYDVMKKYGKL